MLQQLLLVFIVIGVVRCQTCPVWTALENDPALVAELNGKTFYKVLASGVNTSNTANCQELTYETTSENIENVYLQSYDWCRQLTNCNATEDYYSCELHFLAPTTGALPDPTKSKIVEKIVLGTNNDCFLVAYCRASEEGVSILCEEQPNNIVTFLLQVLLLLANLLGLLEVPELGVIDHSSCEFVDPCPPL